jgi:hypothetical protein
MVLYTLLPQEAKIPIQIGRLTVSDREIKTAFGCTAFYMLYQVSHPFFSANRRKT